MGSGDGRFEALERVLTLSAERLFGAALVVSVSEAAELLQACVAEGRLLEASDVAEIQAWLDVYATLHRATVPTPGLLGVCCGTSAEHGWVVEPGFTRLHRVQHRRQLMVLQAWLREASRNIPMYVIEGWSPADRARAESWAAVTARGSNGYGHVEEPAHVRTYGPEDVTGQLRVAQETIALLQAELEAARATVLR